MESNENDVLDMKSYALTLQNDNFVNYDPDMKLGIKISDVP